MTAQEMKQLMFETVDALEKQGWDYDQARFAAMTIGKNPEGWLGEQPAGQSHPLLVAFAQKTAGFQQEPAKPLPPVRDLTDEMEDQ